MILTAAQVRAARALLGWTSPRLARSAKVSFGKALKAQNDEGVLTLSGLDRQAIRSALETADVVFEKDGAVRLPPKVIS